MFIVLCFFLSAQHDEFIIQFMCNVALAGALPNRDQMENTWRRFSWYCEKTTLRNKSTWQFPTKIKFILKQTRQRGVCSSRGSRKLPTQKVNRNSKLFPPRSSSIDVNAAIKIWTLLHDCTIARKPIEITRVKSEFVWLLDWISIPKCTPRRGDRLEIQFGTFEQIAWPHYEVTLNIGRATTGVESNS